MKNYVGWLWGIVGVALLSVPVDVAAGASDKPVTGDTVIRETQEAVTSTKDYTIQQKDAFQRKVQTELDEIQLRITQLRGQGDRGIRKEKGPGHKKSAGHSLRNCLFLGAGKVENHGCDGRSSRFSRTGPVSSPVTVDQ